MHTRHHHVCLTPGACRIVLIFGLGLLSALPLRGQNLSMNEIVRTLPEALADARSLAPISIDGVLGKAKDAEEWRRTFSGWARKSIFNPGGGSAEEEAAKRALRALFETIARIGHSQYDFQVVAERALNGINTYASKTAPKVKGWSDQLKTTMDAVTALDRALAGGRDSTIKSAYDKVRNELRKAISHASAMSMTQGSVEGYRRTWALHRIRTEMHKIRDRWRHELFGSALELPGVKAFVDEQIKEIDSFIVEYTYAMEALERAARPVLGDPPPILVAAGIRNVKLDDLEKHWTDLRKDIITKMIREGRTKHLRIPVVD